MVRYSFLKYQQIVALDNYNILVYDIVTKYKDSDTMTSKWIHMFFGEGEAQRIEKNVEGFVDQMVTYQPKDAECFILGAAYDFGINGNHVTSDKILNLAKAHFPSEDVEEIKEFISLTLTAMKDGMIEMIVAMQENGIKIKKKYDREYEQP